MKRISDGEFNTGDAFVIGFAIILIITAIFIYHAYYKHDENDKHKQKDKKGSPKPVSLEPERTIDDVIKEHFLNGENIKRNEDKTPQNDNEKQRDNNDITNNKTPNNMKDTNNNTQQKTGDRKEQQASTNTWGTKTLLFNTMDKLGCKLEPDENTEGRYITIFQGEQFVIDVDDTSAFIIVWDLWWDMYELYDIDNLSRLKKAINSANIRFNTSSLYSIDENGKTLGVHTKMRILLIPQIPDIENYLHAMISEFFHVKNFIKNEIYRLKIEEENS